MILDVGLTPVANIESGTRLEKFFVQCNREEEGFTNVVQACKAVTRGPRVESRRGISRIQEWIEKGLGELVIRIEQRTDQSWIRP